MRYLLGFVLLVFLAALGLFALQNTQTVTVRFLQWGVTSPFALVAVGIYLLGMLSGWNVVAFLRSSLKRVTAEPQTR